MLPEPQPVDCPSERGRNYTPPEGSVLRPAGGVSASAPVGAELTSTGRHAPCGKRMIARSVPAPVNHHRGSYTSPALAAASYPFVDLPPGNTLRCKLFPSSKFTILLFPKVAGHSIIEPATNRTFMEVIRMFQELGISAGTAIIILIALYFIIKWSVKNRIKEAYKDITGKKLTEDLELETLLEENADNK